jgi:hypothetical protein
MARVANSMLIFCSKTSVMTDEPMDDDDVIFWTPLTAARASSSGAVTFVWTISGGTPGQEVLTSTCG